MTAEQRLVVACVLAVVLWMVLQQCEKIMRCNYCGSLGDHKQDCPFDFLNREEKW